MPRFSQVRIGARVAGAAVALLLVLAAPLPGKSGSFGEPFPAPEFRLEWVSGDREQLDCRFSAAQSALLEKLNRIDRGGLAALGKIVVPDRWDLPESAYSPLPRRFTWAAYFPQAVVVSKRLQAFAAYEDGRLARWGPVSTGAAGSPTPGGLFHLNWRSPGPPQHGQPQLVPEVVFQLRQPAGALFPRIRVAGHCPPATDACAC